MLARTLLLFLASITLIKLTLARNGVNKFKFMDDRTLCSNRIDSHIDYLEFEEEYIDSSTSSFITPSSSTTSAVVNNNKTTGEGGTRADRFLRDGYPVFEFESGLAVWFLSDVAYPFCGEMVDVLKNIYGRQRRKETEIEIESEPEKKPEEELEIIEKRSSEETVTEIEKSLKTDSIDTSASNSSSPDSSFAYDDAFIGSLIARTNSECFRPIYKDGKTYSLPTDLIALGYAKPLLKDPKLEWLTDSLEESHWSLWHALIPKKENQSDNYLGGVNGYGAEDVTLLLHAFFKAYLIKYKITGKNNNHNNEDLYYWMTNQFRANVIGPSMRWDPLFDTLSSTKGSGPLTSILTTTTSNPATTNTLNNPSFIRFILTLERNLLREMETIDRSILNEPRAHLNSRTDSYGSGSRPFYLLADYVMNSHLFPGYFGDDAFQYPSRSVKEQDKTRIIYNTSPIFGPFDKDVIKRFRNLLLTTQNYFLLESMLTQTFSPQDRSALTKFLRNETAGESIDPLNFTSTEIGRLIELIGSVPYGEMAGEVKRRLIASDRTPFDFKVDNSPFTYFYGDALLKLFFSGNSWDLDTGYGPLHLAVIYNNLDFVKRAMKSSVAFNLDAKSSLSTGQRTPTILAAIYNRPTILSFLSSRINSRSSHLLQPDALGLNALDYAFHSGMDFSVPLHEPDHNKFQCLYFEVYRKEITFAALARLILAHEVALSSIGGLPVPFIRKFFENCDIMQFSWSWFHQLYQEGKKIWANKPNRITPSRLLQIIFPNQHKALHNDKIYSTYVDHIVDKCSQLQVSRIDGVPMAMKDHFLIKNFTLVSGGETSKVTTESPLPGFDESNFEELNRHLDQQRESMQDQKLRYAKEVNKEDREREELVLSCDTPYLIATFLNGYPRPNFLSPYSHIEISKRFPYLFKDLSPYPTPAMNVRTMQRVIQDFAERSLAQHRVSVQMSVKHDEAVIEFFGHLESAINGEAGCRLDFFVPGVTFAHVSAAFGMSQIIGDCALQGESLAVIQANSSEPLGIPSILSLLIVNVESAPSNLLNLKISPKEYDILNVIEGWSDPQSVLLFLHDSSVLAALDLDDKSGESLLFARILDLLRKRDILLGAKHISLLEHMGNVLDQSRQGDFLAYLLQSYPRFFAQHFKTLCERNKINLSISDPSFYPKRMFANIDLKVLTSELKPLFNFKDWWLNPLEMPISDHIATLPNGKRVDNLQFSSSSNHVVVDPFENVFFHLTILMKDAEEVSKTAAQYSCPHNFKLVKGKCVALEAWQSRMAIQSFPEHPVTPISMQEDEIFYGPSIRYNDDRVKNFVMPPLSESVLGMLPDRMNHLSFGPYNYDSLAQNLIASTFEMGYQQDASRKQEYVVRLSETRCEGSRCGINPAAYFSKHKQYLRFNLTAPPEAFDLPFPDIEIESDEEEEIFPEEGENAITIPEEVDNAQSTPSSPTPEDQTDDDKAAAPFDLLANLKYIIPSIIAASLLILFLVYLYQLYQKVVIIAFARDMAREYFTD